MKGFDEKKKSRKNSRLYKNFSKDQIFELAISYHSKGDYTKAIEYYQLFIDRGYTDPRVYCNYGVVCKQVGRNDDAIKLYRESISIYKNDHNSYCNLGNLLKDIGELEEAEELTRKAIELNPDFSTAYSNLGLILRAKGKLKEAEANTRKAIELDSDFVDAHVNLANILTELGDLGEAESFYRKTIELAPNHLNPYISLSLVLNTLGKVKEAETSVREALKINPDLPEANLALGLLLRDQGKLIEAEKLFIKTTELNTNFPEAYSNLGLIWNTQGRLLEAESSTKIAIQLDPNSANYHLNLAIVLYSQGKLEEAEDSSRKAIELNPNFSMAYSCLGGILKELELPEKAIDAYIKAIEISPNSISLNTLITRNIKDLSTLNINKDKIILVLNHLFECQHVRHLDLFEAFNCIYDKGVIDDLIDLEDNIVKRDSFQEIINDNIFIKALKIITFRDVRWEKLLTKLRRDIFRILESDDHELQTSQLNLTIALAEQCFLNEYVYLVTEHEKTLISKLIRKCREEGANEFTSSLLACYFPLHKILDQVPTIRSINSTNKNFNDLLKIQISEPALENILRRSIKKVGSIRDDISKKVRIQYEEHPYPRWKYAYTFIENKVSAVEAINNEIRPNSISFYQGSEKLKVLIAGCGTGNQVLQAQRYQNAHITAIDLSSSSLAYTQRKINELGINNVELIQMDILDLGLLNQNFDVIECTGVLHHMKKPLEGLNSLLNIMNETGFMKIALYSELSRKSIIKARAYIESMNIQPSLDNIRNFRQDLISGKIPEIESLATSGSDFFTTSECRDLCFHYQEHRFTINQIEKILTLNHLEFLGFQLPQQSKSIYHSYFPQDKVQTNLKNWDFIEVNHPEIFSSTPSFWVNRKL